MPDSDKESLHIGKIIEQELRDQERSVTWLSRKLYCDRRNVYDIFSRQYIDTGLLLRISIALGKDFFTYYSRILKPLENQQITPPAKYFTINQFVLIGRGFIILKYGHGEKYISLL